MGLTSYSIFDKKKKKKKRRRFIGDLVVGGTDAIVGIGLLSETSNAVARL